MPHPIQQRLQPIATQARRVVMVSALTTLATVLLASALASGWIDFVFRIHDRGMRLLLSMAVLTGAVFVVWRFVLPACRRHFGELEIALRLERHFPELKDQLSSSVEFLAQRDDDPVAGSAALRHAVIHRAEIALDEVRAEDVIRITPAIRTSLICSAMLVVVLVHAWWKPALVWTAARRLVVPWAGATWPRIHQLEFESPPTQLIAGNDLELRVVDRSGTFPDAVFLEYRFDGAPSGRVQRREMSYRGGRMVALVPNVSTPLRFRAWGGDDRDMPWSRVEVLAAPALSDLRIVLRPPAYTGRPAVHVTGDFQAVEGTQVEMRGTASKPLARAQLRISGESRGETVIDLQLGSDGRQFALGPSAWVVSQSGTYALLLTDRGGLRNSTHQWKLVCFPDQPPRPTLRLGGTLPFVTPRSNLTLMISAEDDWGIESLVMQFGSAESANLGEALDRVADQMELVSGGIPLSATGVSWSSSATARLSGELSWRVADWVPMEPGSVLQLTLVARDGRPDSVRTHILELPVVTDDKMRNWLEGRQRPLLKQVSEVLAIQKAAYDVTRAARDETASHEDLEPGLRQRLQMAEVKQRDVRERLLSGTDAVSAEVARLLANLDHSGITLPDLRTRLTAWQAQLAAVGRDQLPGLEQMLAGVIKELPRGPAAWSRIRGNVAARLEMATQSQQRVMGELEAVVAALSQWQALEDVIEDLREILREQTDLGSNVKAWRYQSVINSNTSSTAEGEAMAGSLRQLELAATFDRAINGLDSVDKNARAHQPETAARVRTALAFSRDAALQALMRQAAVRIRQQQWGPALAHQQQVQTGLATLLRTLANNEFQQQSRERQQLTYQQLQRLREILEAVYTRQQALVQRVEQLKNVASREDMASVANRMVIQDVGSQQQELAEKLASVSADLQGTRVTQLVLQQCAASMSEAARRILAGLIFDIELRRAQSTAMKKLELTLQALRLLPNNNANGSEGGVEHGTEAQSSAAQWNLLAELSLLKLMQEEVLTQTERLHAAGLLRGGLSDSQRRELRALAEQQGTLANLLPSLPSLSDTPATLPADENP